MSDLGEWSILCVSASESMLSRIADNSANRDNLGSAAEVWLDFLGFLGAIGDLLVHDRRCLGWGFCTSDSPLCPTPWDGVWSPLLGDAVVLYLGGGDVSSVVG